MCIRDSEGTESGGHVGEMTTMALVPQVVDAVSVPVIAAGGIADGRQLAAALALGAAAEAIADSGLDTCLLYTSPVRVLKNRMSREYVRQEKAGADKMELERTRNGESRGSSCRR